MLARTHECLYWEVVDKTGRRVLEKAHLTKDKLANVGCLKKRAVTYPNNVIKN